MKHKHDCSVMTYRGHRVLMTLIRCYFSPSSTTGQQFVYSGSADGGVYVYDSVSGVLVSQLAPLSTAPVRDVSWHPTKPLLASSSWDGTIAVWEHLSPAVHERCDDVLPAVETIGPEHLSPAAPPPPPPLPATSHRRATRRVDDDES